MAAAHNRILLVIIGFVVSLILFTGFGLVFTALYRVSAGVHVAHTPTPAPTFTPSVAPPAPAVAQITPSMTLPSPQPVSTPTPTITLLPPTPTDTPLPTVTPTPTQARPQAVAATAVNVRSGPGTNYPVIAALPPNVAVLIVGRNDAATWWVIEQGGASGWVSGAVVNVNNTAGVPLVQAPPPPATPTPTTPPATPTPVKPQYQYEATGWWHDRNYGLTRFLGNITDVNGNPVNGVSVEAQCGNMRVISNPSGPVGWPPFYLSAGDPAGFYDITLDTRPIACEWFLTVVETPDGKTVTARMSEAIYVRTTIESSIVVANWRKNW